MHPEKNIDLSPIIALLNDILQKKGPLKNLSEIKALYPSLVPVLEDLIKLREFSQTLSVGDLQQTLGLRGYFAGSLKGLQANLRHLTWQSSMVASGDYSQRVDFMGDFSLSFNSMIQKLKEAAEQEKKYKLLAENTEDVIWLLDTEMRLQYISPSIAKMMGYAQESLEGRLLADLPLPFMHAAFPDGTMGSPIRDSDFVPRTVEINQLGCNGRMIWTETSVTTAYDANENHVGFSGVTRNISQRKITEGLLQLAYERKQRNKFFNRLLVSKISSTSEVQDLAAQSKLSVPNSFSLYYLGIATYNEVQYCAQETDLPERPQLIDALIDYLNRKDNLIAWELPHTGIGIIETRYAPATKQTEILAAQGYVEYLFSFLPEASVYLGIADFSPEWTDFPNRLEHARIAAKVGASIYSEQQVCHYDDCGVFQALAPFAATQESAQYIHRTLGPLVEYDHDRGTDLVNTLEQLLSGLSLKEIAAETFLHHKTIQLRKHRIEQLLNLSLDNHETRMALSAAIQLRKLVNPQS